MLGECCWTTRGWRRDCASWSCDRERPSCTMGSACNACLSAASAGGVGALCRACTRDALMEASSGTSCMRSAAVARSNVAPGGMTSLPWWSSASLGGASPAPCATWASPTPPWGVGEMRSIPTVLVECSVGGGRPCAAATKRLCVGYSVSSNTSSNTDGVSLYSRSVERYARCIRRFCMAVLRGGCLKLCSMSFPAADMNAAAARAMGEPSRDSCATSDGFTFAPGVSGRPAAVDIVLTGSARVSDLAGVPAH